MVSVAWVTAAVVDVEMLMSALGAYAGGLSEPSATTAVVVLLLASAMFGTREEVAPTQRRWKMWTARCGTGDFEGVTVHDRTS